MSDIAVSSCRIIDRTSDLLFRSQRQFLCLSVNVCLDLLLYLCLHLMSGAVDHLDSVVIERIVARGDHNSAVKILCSHNIGNTRSGRHVKEISIRARSSKPCCQRILKHVAAPSRILADHDPCLVVLAEIPAQVASYLKCVLNCKNYICLTAETVGPKIFSHNNRPLVFIFYTRTDSRHLFPAPALFYYISFTIWLQVFLECYINYRDNTAETEADQAADI